MVGHGFLAFGLLDKNDFSIGIRPMVVGFGPPSRWRAAQRLVQERSTPLSLVAKSLDQALGGDVVAFVAGIVDPAHSG
jgi:hypothetical protein